MPALTDEQRDLVESNLGMARACAWRFRAYAHIGDTAYDYDDLLQTAAAALVVAAERYDPRRSNDASFSTYAYRYLTGAMRNYVSKMRKHKRVTNLNTLSLENQITDDLDADSFIDLIAGGEDTAAKVFERLTFEELSEALSPYAKMILYMRLADMSQAKIAERLNVQPKVAGKYLDMISTRLSDAKELLLPSCYLN